MSLPTLIAFDIANHHDIINHQLVLTTVNDTNAIYKLKAIMYYGNHHFTNCFITDLGEVLYIDGLTVIYEGTLNILMDLSHCSVQTSTAVLYARVD